MDDVRAHYDRGVARVGEDRYRTWVWDDIDTAQLRIDPSNDWYQPQSSTWQKIVNLL